tara:strand:- start:150 stop:341 length:192 start_codon:yes stop_codon:yes gene_type:complete
MQKRTNDGQNAGVLEDASETDEERNNELENQYIMEISKQDPSIGQRLIKAHSLPELDLESHIE